LATLCQDEDIYFSAHQALNWVNLILSNFPEAIKHGESATFKKLLISLASQPMDKQKKAIEENFENWKGSIAQVDDVCIIGVRI
jgi:hypothetical protein